MEGQSTASASLNIDRSSDEREGGRQGNWQERDGDVSRVKKGEKTKTELGDSQEKKALPPQLTVTI